MNAAFELEYVERFAVTGVPVKPAVTIAYPKPVEQPGGKLEFFFNEPLADVVAPKTKSCSVVTLVPHLAPQSAVIICFEIEKILGVVLFGLQGQAVREANAVTSGMEAETKHYITWYCRQRK
jgi:hypothetical protein